MVRYLDPEDNPEEPRRRGKNIGERLARIREKNAALDGVQAFEAAREVALNRLDRRSCTEEELRRAIVGKGFSSQLAAGVVQRLVDVGLVNDHAYAQAFVRDRFSLSGKTGRALSEDLRRRGVGASDIEQALDSIDTDQQIQRARQLVEHRLASFHGVSRDAAYRRLTSLLARKGYPAPICIQVVGEALRGYDPS